ncbi:hypothetical protein RO3G_03280 [Rhizopus delemar RA 99-880]|uniref:Uncharacterized protein n=1 Tax=Rhizopus delemar (strain RA 99-880 / ATCC MYA-4621 / FGSC 9543 / NRRL 43880) TaxID=246409 RepID=I1BQU6_RHIO9|nr:hypothetical protein RO3G_03280 [Rhizopus delemar RA 99-880]|eukprot:EIE78576.1 hypothetical protein RO3G_03280 [Rhizopus delemar RA 99-880]
MLSSRLPQVALAIGVGVATGIYVFQPLIKQYEQETKGTWVLPTDEERLKKIQERREK